MSHTRRHAIGLAFAAIGAAASAQGTAPADAKKAVQLDPVEVKGHYDNSVGSSDAASGGIITPQLIEDRPLLRPGNLLEYVPGMVVTQHSGAGKANQYFLRGFNLDHGTDFSTWVAGMPVNLRTHGHGQGYTDLNFIIPELISRRRLLEGPVLREHRRLQLCGRRQHALLRQHEGRRRAWPRAATTATAARSSPARRRQAPATSLTASSFCTTTGPGSTRTTSASTTRCCAIRSRSATASSASTAMAYGGKWNSTDQVAQRAVDGGLVGRFGSLDASDGGESQRYSFSADYATPLAGGQFQTTAYWFKYKLNLFSNFTYFLDDPVNGDQFEQADDRNVYGWTGKWSKPGELLRQGDRPTRSATSCARTASARRPLFDAAPRAPVDHARRRRQRGKCRHLRAERDAME